METYDYIVVGAGSTGCVIANRLSEDADVTVCLLEAGPVDWNPYIHIPAGFIKTFTDPTVNWLYRAEPSEWTGGRRIAYPRGKTLGGSSSINGNVYNRGNRMDFDGWAQRGNRGWGYADILPYFRRAEMRIGQGDNRFRGRDGPLTVTDNDWLHPLCEAFIEGAVQFGMPRNPDYNGMRQEGVNYTQRTIKNGLRVSTAKAYLRPIKSRPNLHIITRAHSTGLIIEDKRVTGVRYNKGGVSGKPRAVYADREVILSAGVINSPQLLQLSGIGPIGLLKSLGIEVKHELAGVGENLRDHYAPRFTVRVKNSDTINERVRGFGLVKEVADWVLFRRGVLTLVPTLIYCFWRSDPGIPNTDLQMSFTPASYKDGVQNQLDDFPGMTMATWQQCPNSVGYVRARSSDPFDKPIIQPNYLAEESDRRVLLAGMKIARQLLGSKPLQPYYDHELFPGKEVQEDDELLAAAKARGTTTFHPMGTCRMGPGTDPMAVVDDQLKVHGLDGLRLADASIMPTMPAANLNASCIIIGEKAADMILGRSPMEPIIIQDVEEKGRTKYEL